MRIILSTTLVLLLVPFYSISQSVLDAFPLVYLKIDSNKLAEILFKGEKVFKFENYLDNDSSFELTPPDHLPMGKYVAFYKNDSSRLALEVTYSNGEKNGTQKEYYLNGNLKVSEDLVNGKRSGKYMYYYRFPANQLCRYEEYKNGKLNGDYILYCPNGKKNTVGKGKNGLECGNWLRWDCDDGNLINEWKYKKGKMVSSKNFKN